MKTIQIILVGLVLVTSSLAMANQDRVPLRVVLQKAEKSNSSGGSLGATVMDILFDSTNSKKIMIFLSFQKAEARTAAKAALYINYKEEVQTALSQLSQSVGDNCLKDRRDLIDGLTLTIDEGRYSLGIFYPHFKIIDGMATMSQYSFGPDPLDIKNLDQDHLDNLASQLVSELRQAIEDNRTFCVFTQNSRPRSSF